ncbi:imidazolonepropionase-like domain-containing protein [Streptomyces erythrochromogenes]|uniref:imidazolonepropionase-like domain-containing protein n=1 Tax=Streptomyces erythrochromogenes TaxID=285574 RepID=UPI003431458A
MLTLHAAELLVTGPGSAPLEGGAVLVEGDRIARVGPYEDLAAGHSHARVRRWPGVLTPGLLVRGADELLERTYYPDDPYEVTELGADPISGAEALVALKLTESRWGHSARRGTQRLLARGVVAVCGRFTVAAVRTAVSRSGLTILPPAPYEGRPDLDPFAGREAAAEAFHGVLEPGAAARFAVFAVADGAELLTRGATTCVATVIGGRLLHRRR